MEQTVIVGDTPCKVTVDQYSVTVWAATGAHMGVTYTARGRSAALAVAAWVQWAGDRAG
jgi:hypothetical protein